MVFQRILDRGDRAFLRAVRMDVIVERVAAHADILGRITPALNLVDLQSVGNTPLFPGENLNSRRTGGSLINGAPSQAGNMNLVSELYAQFLFNVGSGSDAVSFPEPVTFRPKVAGMILPWIFLIGFVPGRCLSRVRKAAVQPEVCPPIGAPPVPMDSSARAAALAESENLIKDSVERVCILIAAVVASVPEIVASVAFF